MTYYTSGLFFVAVKLISIDCNKNNKYIEDL